MARDFAGTASDYAHTTTDGLGGVTGDDTAYTMSGWANTDARNTYNCAINLFNSGNNYLSRALIRSSGNVLFQEVGPSGVGSCESTGALIGDGAWHHVACRRGSNTDRSVVVDGDFGNEGTNATSCGDLGLARASAGISRFNASSVLYHLNGRVAEFGVWNVKLSNADVTALAAGYSPALVRPDALVRHWELMGASDPEPDRYGGSGLTIVGTAPYGRHCRVINKARHRAALPLTAGAPPAGAPPAMLANRGILGPPLINSGMLR